MPNSKELPESAGEILSSQDARYLQGIKHFNAREFYDAHEVWEDLWHTLQGTEADFVQGLIQFATALHHFEAQNLKGARILYQGGVELLAPLGETYWGLPVKKLLDDMHACIKEVLPYAQKDLPGRYHPDKNAFPVHLDEKLIPKITLVPERAS
jgi:predicted metal-dependent hydrolase